MPSFGTSVSRRRLLQLVSSASVAGVLRAETPQAAKPVPSPVATAPRPAREVRAIWVHPESHIAANEAEGKAQVREMVQRFAKANFNTLFPWTVSGYLAALDHEAYREKHPLARWDALGVLVEEAAREGLDVDMWYSFTDYREADSPEFDPKLGGDPAWMAKRLDELMPEQKLMKLDDKHQQNVCPQHYQARAWMQAQLKRTSARYPKLHGLQIEEPGYGTRGYCVCELCRNVYEQLHGRKLTEVLDSETAEDFRTLGNSAMIEELRAMFKGTKLQLAANGGHDWRHDRIRGRDWGRWGASGWLNYFIPQVYVGDVATFRSQLQRTLDDIGSECPVYAGMALASTSGDTTVGMLAQQIEAARELGAPGVALFHGAAFKDADLEALRAGPFRKQV